MKTICVYCGSSDGRQPAYVEAARLLGNALVERNIGLVYGGASIGLMTEVADTVLNGGGKVIGVIPRALAKKEVMHAGLTELHIVSSMHERKAKMAELAEGFMALPGGLGTLEELFEILTWAQLGMHQKPCAILNVQGYYDHLLSFLQHAVKEAFLKPINLDMLIQDKSVAALFEKMFAYRAPVVEQFIDSSET